MKVIFVGDEEIGSFCGINIGDIVDVYFEEEPCGDDYCRIYYYDDVVVDIELFRHLDGRYLY